MKLNANEIKTLQEAIRYYQARKVSYSSKDKEVAVLGKLNEELNKTDLEILLEIINENIKFLNNYKYQGLSEAQIKINKDRIFIPLKELKQKINSFL